MDAPCTRNILQQMWLWQNYLQGSGSMLARSYSSPTTHSSLITPAIYIGSSLCLRSFKLLLCSCSQLVITQAFRLKTEGYRSVPNARIKSLKIFSISTIFGSISNESSCMITHDWPLKTFGLQSIPLSSCSLHDVIVTVTDSQQSLQLWAR